MYYRDMTRAAPTAALTVDRSMADGAALDALTVYLMRNEHIRVCTTCSAYDTHGEAEGADSVPHDAFRQQPNVVQTVKP